MAIFDPYTARFNRLFPVSPRGTAMSRTDIRTDNILRQRPPVTAPALSPMMQRVARQAAQSRLATPRRPLPPVTGQTPPQQTQEADTGLMGALRAPLMSPRGQAISQAALAGLEAGGYTTMPTTLGQAIGKMGQAALLGYGAGQDRQAQIEAAELAKKADARTARLQELQAMTALAKAQQPSKPVMKMLPVEGGTQLTMLDPITGEILGKVGGVKPASGMQVSVDAEGNITFTQGATGVEKGTKKDLEKDVLSLTSQISMLDQAKLAYDPSLLTYKAELENLYGTTLSKINPEALSPEQKDRIARRTQFVRGIQQTFSQLLNELSGAAVSAFELRNAKKYSVNPDDSPIQFESKLRDQTGFAKAALYRAQQILGGESITNDLSQKYPISISGKDSEGNVRTLYMHEFVEKYMQNNDVDQATAIEAYAEMAKGSR